jgi:transposase
MTSISRQDIVWVGLDVHKISISAAVVAADRDRVEVTNLMADDASVRKFFSHQGPPERVRVVYEAGPTGYDLQRKLASMGIACQVAAPSLIPRAPGDKVKTDRRDAARLARLLRSGDLVAIRVPTRAEEAVRDLCRARADMVEDLTRARNRLGKFLLRHGEVWAGASNWTLEHRRWLAARHFDEKALKLSFGRYMAVMEEREADLDATTADLVPYYTTAPFDNAVLRLSCYRGIDRLGALTIATEVCDFRRFGKAEHFASFTGLVPSEHSSGASVHRGRLTKAGNAHLRHQLVESAWSYRHRPGVGATLKSRQQGAPAQTVARAWAAQQRLSARYRALSARKNVQSVVAAAVARELACWLWAEMVA